MKTKIQIAIALALIASMLVTSFAFAGPGCNTQADENSAAYKACTAADFAAAEDKEDKSQGLKVGQEAKDAGVKASDLVQSAKDDAGISGLGTNKADTLDAFDAYIDAASSDDTTDVPAETNTLPTSPDGFVDLPPLAETLPANKVGKATCALLDDANYTPVPPSEPMSFETFSDFYDGPWVITYKEVERSRGRTWFTNGCDLNGNGWNSYQADASNSGIRLNDESLDLWALANKLWPVYQRYLRGEFVFTQ